MVTAAERIDDLMHIHPKGFDLSLDRITRLLEKLGNPQLALPPVIHVAGTNGKGSTIAFCRAILEAAGLSVHVHTSPHLVNWHERYRIGQIPQKGQEAGQLVSDDMLSDAIMRVALANGGEAITVFEVLSAVMFVLFSEQPADVCLVEVGLGGRFDATNVLPNPAVTIVTPVSFDHEAYLGDTLAKIAFEKAGIIKSGAAVICAEQDEEAFQVIERQAARHKCRMSAAGMEFSALREDGRMVWQDEKQMFDLPLPKMSGEHQIDNAGVAIAACLEMAKQIKFPLTGEMIGRGLQSAFWPGRMQVLNSGAFVDRLPKGCEVWLDGGHNPGAAKIIQQFLRTLDRKSSKQLVIICGMLTTKDPTGYFSNLVDLNPKVLTVPIQSSDAGFSAKVLADHAKNTGLDAQGFETLELAIDYIVNEQHENLRILIAGSLYLVGDMLAANGTPPT